MKLDGRSEFCKIKILKQAEMESHPSIFYFRYPNMGVLYLKILGKIHKKLSQAQNKEKNNFPQIDPIGTTDHFP